jgi:hypoxanthine phosphoribosyltransferase
MEIIIRQEDIAKRVKELAKTVSADHVFETNNTQHPVLVCILNGSFHFFSDLTRMMSIDCEVDFIRLKSYAGQDNSQGVNIIKGFELDFRFRRNYENSNCYGKCSWC